ncbi:hypothetical protein M407DRAFT_93095 [Tulasnella calospora MUT 4182]|uniref:Uncharacterized protein n=1 Tax=Tulasnella calospora MUT 4182 TaxID=1051891 RepID=A0A0C3QG78_9AGAM|nr:hypothetical protein M407DRAFT_93095 [Tulasnella calospora MUT 4182]
MFRSKLLPHSYLLLCLALVLGTFFVLPRNYPRYGPKSQNSGRSAEEPCCQEYHKYNHTRWPDVTRCRSSSFIYGKGLITFFPLSVGVFTKTGNLIFANER